MKKIFSLVVSLALLLTALPTQVKALTSNPGPGVVVDSYSVSLRDSIDLNVYLRAVDDAINYNLAYVEFACEDGRKTYYDVHELEENKVIENGQTYYRISIPMAARQMVDKLNVTAICNDDEIRPLLECSVQSYASYVLDHANQFGDNVVHVVKSMINYGARAQVYFDHKPNQLANSILPEFERDEFIKDSVFPEYAFSDHQPRKEGTVTGLNYYGTSVLLRSKAIISHYFTLEEGHTIDEYTFQLNGKVLTPVKSGDRYYVDIANIFAEDLMDVYDFEVIHGDEKLIISYGILSYGWIVAESDMKDQYSPVLQELMRTLWVYADEVDYYVQELERPQ